MIDLPTAEEWSARQDKAPDGLKRIARQAQEARDAAKLAEQQRREEEDQALVLHRNDFEAQLAFLIESEGGDWLHKFRVPDERFSTQPFGLQTHYWLAEFDLREVGYHPVQVTLEYSHAAGWHPVQEPLAVRLPSRVRRFRTLADAVAVAGQYCDIPF